MKLALLPAVLVSMLPFAPAVAVAAVSPAAAQAADATWYIDGSNPGALPRHFELAPRNPGLVAKTIASAVLLPNVLVRLDQAVVHGDGRTYSAPSGQAFRVAYEARPTFCPIDRIGNMRFYCLIDTDGDGVLDSDVEATALVLAPRVFRFNQKSLAKLAQPVRYTALDRSESRYRLPIELIYTGWNGFSGQDRRFEIIVTGTAGKETFFGTSNPMIYYIDKLPPAIEVLGVRLENIRADGKNFHLDVVSGFATGPFDVRADKRRNLFWGS